MAPYIFWIFGRQDPQNLPLKQSNLEKLTKFHIFAGFGHIFPWFCPRAQNPSGKTTKKLRIRQPSRGLWLLNAQTSYSALFSRYSGQILARFCLGEASKSPESVREDHQKAQNSTTVTRIVALKRTNLVFCVVFPLFRPCFGQILSGRSQQKPRIRPGRPPKSSEFDNCHENCVPETHKPRILRCFPAIPVIFWPDFV